MCFPNEDENWSGESVCKNRHPPLCFAQKSRFVKDQGNINICFIGFIKTCHVFSTWFKTGVKGRFERGVNNDEYVC